MNIRRILSPLTTFGLFAAMCGVLTLAANTPASAYSLARCTSVERVAHRGLVDRRHTEDTMRSYLNAYNHGARSIENDIQLTRDGQWVFMHDPTINRTTNGTGTVASKTVAQLKRYKTNDGVLGGIPTLAQGLNFLKAHPSVRMQIEIKPATASNEAIKLLLDQINQYGVKDRVMITSFAKMPLAKLRVQDPTMSTGFLTVQRVTVATAKQYGNSAILINQRNVTAAFISNMHAAGLRVYTWTVNTRASWSRMVRLGSDGITSDRTPTMAVYCRRV